jgi:hypothetical protein
MGKRSFGERHVTQCQQHVDRAARRKLIAKGGAIGISYGAYSDHRLRRGLRDNLRRTARHDRHAQTAVERSHEPQDGWHHGHLPDLVGDLWPLNWLGKHRHLERNCGLHESSYGRGVYVRSWPGKAIVIATERGRSRSRPVIPSKQRLRGTFPDRASGRSRAGVDCLEPIGFP